MSTLLAVVPVVVMFAPVTHHALEDWAVAVTRTVGALTVLLGRQTQAVAVALVPTTVLLGLVPLVVQVLSCYARVQNCL